MVLWALLRQGLRLRAQQGRVLYVIRFRYYIDARSVASLTLSVSSSDLRKICVSDNSSKATKGTKGKAIKRSSGCCTRAAHSPIPLSSYRAPHNKWACEDTAKAPALGSNRSGSNR